MRSPLARNAFANVVQMVVGAALLFVLYRYINTTLGVSQLGVWSVVLATASASRLADMGLSTGVTRFVARDLARGEPERAARVVDTAALTLMAALGLVLPLAYPLLANVLGHLFDPAHLELALKILPYALVSLWLTMVAAVIQSGLDGCQRMDLRAGLVTVGQALLLLFALWLVPTHGLVGLAWAQIAQGVFLVLFGRPLLRRALPELPWLPRRWRKSVFREMLGYGVNVQAATIFMLLFDPVTKALMARFGGPAAAGYFEMANQVVLKARGVIVAANQAIVPRVAELAATTWSRLAALYRDNLRILIFVTLPVYSLLLAWAGWASWLLVGEYRSEFVFLLHVSTIGWALNTFAAPAYFMHLGKGDVGWNTLSHVVMGVMNVALGLMLGRWFGAHGVAWAYVIALATGSWLLIGLFQARNRIGWTGWAAREHLWLAAVCAVVSVAGWLDPVRTAASEPARFAVWLVGPPLALGLAAWFHPMRKELWHRLDLREARL